MKILFMGTPDFARESLKSLVESGFEIIAVVTNPDKPQGRGMKMVASEVKQYAMSKNIPIYQPEKIRKNEEFIAELKQLNPDLICVVAYGKILPKEVLEIPTLGCINVHGSLLPKYRGAAPIQWAVINGETKTGITTMYMDTGMDTGDMILKKEVEIGKDETTGELWERLSKLGGELLVETVKLIGQGKAPREKQTGEFSMALMLNKEMAKIEWEQLTALQIKNLVRGLNPIMGAYTFVNDKKIKFWKVNNITEKELIEKFPELEEYEYKIKEMIPGTIIFSSDKTGLFIKAKEEIVEILEIQGENAKRMNIKDFLRGNKLDVGQIFE